MKQIWEREWFNYTTERVPTLSLEAMKQRNESIKKEKRGAEIFYVGTDQAVDPNKRSVQTPRVFYRKETSVNPFVVAKP